MPQILPGLLNMQILYRNIRIYLPTSFIEKRFGSDNFADYMRKAPGTYVHVGSTDGERTAFPHHNEHFDIAEDSLVYAAALAAQYTVDFCGGKTEK